MEWNVYKQLPKQQEKGYIPEALALTTMAVDNGQVPVLVLSFIDGSSAMHASREEWAEIAVPLREIYQSLWGLRVVHGDVAERNVVLKRGGGVVKPVLVDFGEAVLDASEQEIEWEKQELEALLRFHTGR
jgi:RIO-like serine/threonine protein kinase